MVPSVLRGLALVAVLPMAVATVALTPTHADASKRRCSVTSYCWQLEAEDLILGPNGADNSISFSDRVTRQGDYIRVRGNSFVLVNDGTPTALNVSESFRITGSDITGVGGSAPSGTGANISWNVLSDGYLAQLRYDDPENPPRSYQNTYSLSLRLVNRAEGYEHTMSSTIQYGRLNFTLRTQENVNAP